MWAFTGKMPSKKGEPLWNKWPPEAWRYMPSGGAGTTKQMIGKLYCAGEKLADEHGSGHADAIVSSEPRPRPLTQPNMANRVRPERRRRQARGRQSKQGKPKRC